MTTIETIAKHAGVSRGTVDRVLHNRGRVKAETMERVQAAMEELHYQPSALGRAFYMSRQNNKIGVLVALREPDFQRQVMEGVEDGIAYAQQHWHGSYPGRVPLYRDRAGAEILRHFLPEN